MPDEPGSGEPCRDRGEEDDHPGPLLEHLASRSARGDELGPQDRGDGRHELLDSQLEDRLAVAMFADARSGRVEFDVDAARLLNDGLEVVVDRRGVEGVDHLSVGPATRGRDLLGDHLDARGRAAGEKHLRTFGRQFLRHRRADGTSTTEHDRTLVLQHSWHLLLETSEPRRGSPHSQRKTPSPRETGRTCSAHFPLRSVSHQKMDRGKEVGAGEHRVARSSSRR